MQQHKSEFYEGIAELKQFVAMPRWERVLRNPIRYAISNWIRRVQQKIYSTPVLMKRETVFGYALTVPLPSGNDIYMSGGKTHPSEIHFARFCIDNMQPGQTVLDVGAHIGYFSTLFSRLVGDTGSVVAIEPSPETVQVLRKNCAQCSNIQVKHAAVSEHEGDLPFFIFPSFYSEYNSFSIERYVSEPWFEQYPPKTVNVTTIQLSHFCEQRQILPDWIKIDVEGVEFQVLQTIESLLQQTRASVIVEVVLPKSESERSIVKQIQEFFQELNYSTFAIQSEGKLHAVSDILVYMETAELDSENIVCLPAEK